MNPPDKLVKAGRRHEKPTLTKGKSEGDGLEGLWVGVTSCDGDAVDKATC